MSAALIIIISVAVLTLSYKTYGSYISRKLKVDSSRKTPAHTMYDGVDYVPARAPVLLGHHFASIAGAAPIIGPIVAATFGWFPVVLWLILGSIFIGSVHDFSSLLASIRHDGRSIGQIIESNIGRSGKILFTLFSFAALILVIAVFTIVVAKTFNSVPSSASSSILFIILAVVFGFTVYRKNVNLKTASVIGVLVLICCLWLGFKFPLSLSNNTWIYILLGYIFIASTAPVWILLQPRDYLNSFLLYAVMFFSVLGIIFLNPKFELPAFTSINTGDMNYIFPMLFITVACGAISGFHSLVASGTTAKQVDNERDTKLIGYGSMLIETLLGIIAIITAAVLSMDKYNALLKTKGPIAVFSSGVGSFMSALNIPVDVGTNLAALAVAAFALTSLDTAARLARYTFQEFFHNPLKEKQSILNTNRYIGTFITVAISGVLALSGKWKSIWPLFGAANQLLAAIALLAITAWLVKNKRDSRFVKIPMIFMFLVTVTALIFLIKVNIQKEAFLISFIAFLLLMLSFVLIFQGYKIIFKTNPVVTGVNPAIEQES